MIHKLNIIKLFLSLFLILVISTNYSQEVKNWNLKTHSNQEIIDQMTLEDKIFLLTGLGDENWTNPSSGKETVIIEGAAGRTWDIPRLGIPATVLADGPAGLRIDPILKSKDFTRYATAFPTATALSSTWNTDLINQVGKATGNEVLEYGVDVLLSPGVNIHRNPLCGRNFEYYSEDPYLAGKMGAAFVNGVQSNGVGTSVKHFAANNMETNRTSLNSVVSQRALREIYLKPFEIIVKEANPWTIMSSYNRLNGFYTSESKDLLTTILRNEWQYNGLVMSDWWAGADAVAQLKAGNNLFMPGSYQRNELFDAIKNHQIDESVLDKNINIILDFIRKTPRFNQYKPSEKPDLNYHLQVAKSAAEEAIILLKNNEQTLPITKKSKIALFGKTSYHYIVGGTGSGEVNYDKASSYNNSLKTIGYEINQDLEHFYLNWIKITEQNTPKDANVKFTVDFAPEIEISSEQIIESSKISDIAIITIGRNAGEGADRLQSDFQLSNSEINLIQNVAKIYHQKGKKVIVMLNIGGVISLNEWQNEVDAILLNWQTGQMGTEAVASILKGIVNPSGKLPMTFPLAYNDVPSANTFPGEPKENPIDALYNEGIFVGYRYYNTFKKSVAFPFGYGLSYTQFKFSDFTTSFDAKSNEISIEFTISNIGKFAGKEVAQIYCAAPKTNLPKPENELKYFVKSNLLKPGETQKFSVKIESINLSSFDPSLSAWTLEKGEYQLLLGNSSQNILQKSYITIDETQIIEKVNDVLYPNKKLNELIPNK